MLRTLGVMREGEMFDSESPKTKVIFIVVQFMYTLASMTPMTLLWSSFRLHLAYLLAIYVSVIGLTRDLYLYMLYVYVHIYIYIHIHIHIYRSVCI